MTRWLDALPWARGYRIRKDWFFETKWRGVRKLWMLTSDGFTEI